MLTAWPPFDQASRDETRTFSISGNLIDPDNAFTDSCAPLAEIPSWWSGFLFHVLNPRQLSLYVYLTLLTGETGMCHPTTKQIRQDLGLASLTIVFEAISVLEQEGFILRRRQNFPELKSRHNVYQRPSCEFTVLRLLQASKIDGLLRPMPGSNNEMSTESRKLRDEWLEQSLGDLKAEYDAGNDGQKQQILMAALRRQLAGTSAS